MLESFKFTLDIPPNPAMISEVTRFNKPKKGHRHIHIYICAYMYTHTHTHTLQTLSKVAIKLQIIFLGHFYFFQILKVNLTILDFESSLTSCLRSKQTN